MQSHLNVNDHHVVHNNQSYIRNQYTELSNKLSMKRRRQTKDERHFLDHVTTTWHVIILCIHSPHTKHHTTISWKLDHKPKARRHGHIQKSHLPLLQTKALCYSLNSNQLNLSIHDDPILWTVSSFSVISWLRLVESYRLLNHVYFNLVFLKLIFHERKKFCFETESIKLAAFTTHVPMALPLWLSTEISMRCCRT